VNGGENRAGMESSSPISSGEFDDVAIRVFEPQREASNVPFCPRLRVGEQQI
jgi:hypothetical protein